MHFCHFKSIFTCPTFFEHTFIYFTQFEPKFNSSTNFNVHQHLFYPLQTHIHLFNTLSSNIHLFPPNSSVPTNFVYPHFTHFKTTVVLTPKHFDLKSYVPPTLNQHLFVPFYLIAHSSVPTTFISSTHFQHTLIYQPSSY